MPTPAIHLSLQPIEAGTFARASEDVLKQRKIIRARRGATSAAAAPAAGSNPFANVQLASGAGALPAAAPANPFAGVSLVAPAAAPAAAEPPAPAVEEETKQAVDEDKKPAEETVAPTAEEPAAKPTPIGGGFGSFGAAAPSGGLAFGSSGGFGSVKTGTGGFGFLGKFNLIVLP